MQQNILQNSNLTKTILIYTDERGLKKRFKVSLRYMDTIQCYFAAPIVGGFQKPKKNTPVLVTVYTTDGVYSSNLQINDTTTTLNEILFEVSLPKVWSFKQSRNSSRKMTDMPISIKFDDGFEITSTTYDLSLDGVSFFYNKPISSIYKKLKGTLTIQFPDNLTIDFPLKSFETETKFIREQLEVKDTYRDGSLYVFGFLELEPKEQELIKKYLISIE